MKKILIVEDEPEIQEMLEAYLKHEGYRVTLASDGVEALDKFHKENQDLILLDIMLPKIDGYHVCELIRSSSAVPVIMLTALDSEDQQLRGFHLKIDDYVTKPFSMPILLEKIAAVLRRTEGTVTSNHIYYKDLVLDLDALEARLEGEPLDLTQREFQLLLQLVTKQGRVWTREMLLENLWGYDFFGDERIVDSHIKNLRKKLGNDYIKTMRGAGYFVEKEEK